MDDLNALFRQAAEQAAAFRAGLAERPVAPEADAETLLAGLGGDLPRRPTPPPEVLRELAEAAAPGLTASPGPRFFGFVIGGAMPAATAADMLAAGWDQNALNPVLAPAAWAAEQVAGTWVKQLLGIPAGASVGFVTGAQAANTAGLAAARHHVLALAGWDVEVRGLIGAPRIRVVAGEERHATVDRALRLLGLGTAVVEPVGTDGNGAMRVEDLARVLAEGPEGPTVVILQSGNVNTGACDDLRAGCEVAHARGAWVHVDGAFGLWAGATTGLRALVDGVELADSWAVDAHKWLNVPYDSAFAICARPDVQVAAMSYAASYLVGSGGQTGRPPGASDLVAESSRRARGFAVWAALRELGTDGVADLVDRCCALARRFAAGLAAAGHEVVNDVVLNQVLVSFGDDARTDAVIEGVQQDGTCWLGGTTWRGRRLMRISVSNYATTQADVDRSVQAINGVAAAVAAGAADDVDQARS
jgi:glutamate/tyrosine decarboxylase-like PLP-dependent enzyme